VDEQYLLDVEREVFVSLSGESKSQDRMGHMLTRVDVAAGQRQAQEADARLVASAE
jgi:hypothetical protein